MSEKPRPLSAAGVRVVIAGGGTGGHLFPGLAIAEQLSAQGAQVTFVGTARGIEAKVVPQSGYPLELIDIAGLKRQGLWLTLRSLLKLPLALFQTIGLLRRLSPSVVVGVGGYASGPVVLLAALLRIPTVVLEQNSVPGVTNR
ncbi:MAG TPA: glycosyltransferase, partial [Pseudomonadota bacterium]|nr:glycosyltransferase [Pseudomonadota bacterium]